VSLEQCCAGPFESGPRRRLEVGPRLEAGHTSSVGSPA
jgi:hypothetical protein